MKRCSLQYERFGLSGLGDFCIWVVTPIGDPRSHAFDEVAESLRYGFASLGHDVPVVRDPRNIVGRPIVIGCNLITQMSISDIPSDAILFNFEQIYDDSPWLTKEYLGLLRSHEVWDYSRVNIARLREHGVERIRFCGIGYVPELMRIPEKEQDIDVLLYGMLSERRSVVIDALNARGRKAVFLTNVYGPTRDDYIARSKIVLNIHHYAARIFEIVRVSYLLSNKKFVLSEPGADRRIETPYTGGILFAPYNMIVDTCEFFLDNPDERTLIANRGHELFRATPQSKYLADVMGT